MEQAEHVLGGSVVRHLVLILATLLGEGTSTLVNPLVAKDLGSLGTLAMERRGRQVSSGGGGLVVSEARVSISCWAVAGQDNLVDLRLR